MVYLETANNSQYKEQATILLLTGWFSKGSPWGAGWVAIMAPTLDTSSGRPPASGGNASRKPLPWNPSIPSQNTLSWGLWCAWAVNETTFPKSDELCS